MDWQEDDIDAPQEIDLHHADEHEDDGGVVECNHCHEYLSEFAERCPSCGMWVTPESVATQRARSWFWTVIIAWLIAMILVIWMKLR